MWLRRMRGAFGMGLAWAIGWGGIGGVMELVANFVPALNAVDMWIQTLAIPGFFAGASFSLVLAIAASRRRFEELSIPRFAVWGAVGGALLGVIALGLGVAPGLPTLLRVALAIAPISLLSAASASGYLAIARMGKERQTLDAGAAPLIEDQSN